MIILPKIIILIYIIQHFLQTNKIIELPPKKCYATNDKPKAVSFKNNNALHGNIINEELILIGSFLMILLILAIERRNNMIKVDNLSFSFVEKDLYNKISFS